MLKKLQYCYTGASLKGMTQPAQENAKFAEMMLLKEPLSRNKVFTQASFATVSD